MFARLVRRSGAVARQMIAQVWYKGAAFGADRSGNGAPMIPVFGAVGADRRHAQAHDFRNSDRVSVVTEPLTRRLGK